MDPGLIVFLKCGLIDRLDQNEFDVYAYDNEIVELIRWYFN